MTKRGELEGRIMDALWDQGPATVREMVRRLDAGLAYTTVLTVLDRLHGKGRVARCKDGQAWCYQAAEPRAAFLADQAAQLLVGREGEQRSTLLAFIDRAEAIAPEVLATLEELIEERRRQRDGVKGTPKGGQP